MRSVDPRRHLSNLISATLPFSAWSRRQGPRVLLQLKALFLLDRDRSLRSLAQAVRATHMRLAVDISGRRDPRQLWCNNHYRLRPRHPRLLRQLEWSGQRRILTYHPARRHWHARRERTANRRLMGLQTPGMPQTIASLVGWRRTVRTNTGRHSTLRTRCNDMPSQTATHSALRQRL